MSFVLFDFNESEINEVLDKRVSPMIKLKALAELFSKDCLPAYLISYIEGFCPAGENSIAIHSPKSISKYTDVPGETDKATITRTRGFIGNREMELDKYPNAIHHINILYNENGKARVFYKYQGNIRFLKTARK